jgi:hypothetical protein
MHWHRLGVVTLTLAVLAPAGCGDERPAMPPVGSPTAPPEPAPPKKPGAVSRTKLGRGATPAGGTGLQQ